MMRVLCYYPAIFSMGFGMKSLVSEYKDLYLYYVCKMQLFRKSKAARELLAYYIICLPIGLLANMALTGRILKGTITLSLYLTLVVRMVDGDNPIKD